MTIAETFTLLIVGIAVALIGTTVLRFVDDNAMNPRDSKRLVRIGGALVLWGFTLFLTPIVLLFV